MSTLHPSLKIICQAYFESLNLPFQQLDGWHFCDNKTDANECAALVMQGIKRATSPSLWWHEASGEPLPKVGDLNIVTNWNGEAQCIIETTKVSIVPFKDITEAYAQLEGEGDKSLEYWKAVHWSYYQRELENTPFAPSEEMPIICEEFQVVFKSECSQTQS